MPANSTSFRSEHPRRQPSFRISTPQLGMLLFLTSLAILFVASLAAYWITRTNHVQWNQIEVGLPWGLPLSTLCIASVSGGLEWARRAVSRNQQTNLQRGLWIAFAAAAGFLVTQVFNWRDVHQLNVEAHSRALSMFTFYMLTGLHALHVLGGFVPLSLVLYRAKQREYSSSRYEGVKLCTQYWHFLGVVWLILLVALVLA